MGYHPTSGLYLNNVYIFGVSQAPKSATVNGQMAIVHYNSQTQVNWKHSHNIANEADRPTKFPFGKVKFTLVHNIEVPVVYVNIAFWATFGSQLIY